MARHGRGISRGVRYGFVLPGGSAVEQVELAKQAEAAGWDAVFVWEAAFGVAIEHCERARPAAATGPR